MCLVISVALTSVSSVYAYLNLFRAESSSTPDSYVFYLWNDYIRNGTPVRIEISFDWQAENLSMTVTVNDDEYNKWDYLGLVFDINKNGKIDYGGKDEPCIVHANNLTRVRKGVYLLENGLFSWAMIDPMPSSFHTCIFDKEVGYTFKISLRRQSINGVEPPMPMHICFVDYENELKVPYTAVGIWVQFMVT